MTNYRQTMAEVLEFMNIMREYKILERDLTDTELKRREEIAQDMDDADFKSRYGDRWKEVKMAVATKQAKKEDGDGPLSTVDEATKYDIYHKTFSDAMQHSYKAAKKMYGITVDDNEIDQKVASGPKKPSAGKTNRYQLKGDKGTIQVQVANLDNKKYELNMYKEEVDLSEDNMDLMRKAADGAMQTIKFKDGKQKMDSFSASGIMQVYDKVNPQNKKAMEKIINSGTVAQILKLQSFAMKQIKSGDEFDHDGEDLEEKFTKKDFDDNEDNNDHTQNAVELVKMFGDNYEKRQVAQIQKDHDKNRSISAKDQKVRDALVKKYLPKLKEDLDEAVKFSAPTKDGNTFQVIDRDAKGMRGSQDKFKMVVVDKKGKEVKDWGSHPSIDGAKKFAKNKKIIEDVELDEGSNSDVIVMGKGRVTKSVLPDAKEIKELEKDGWRIQGVIEKGSKILKKDAKSVMKAIKGGDKLKIGEAVELEEATEKDIISALKKERIGGYFSGGKLYVAQRKLEMARDLLRDLKLKTMPQLVGEEVFRFQKDIIENLFVESGMSDLHQHIKDGKSAKEISKLMKVDVKTVEKLMKGFNESARSDARKAMRNDPLLGKRDEKEVDDTASDTDVKAASKNVMFQLQQVLKLKGRAGELKLTPAKKKEIAALGTQYDKRLGSGFVEFSSGKKEKVDLKIARAVWDKYQSLRRPIDKQKFQIKISKSYKDMLSALKESIDEGTWQMPTGPKGRAGLKKLMKKPIKAKDAVDAIDPYIGDDEMFDDFEDLEKDDPNQDVRPTIKAAMKRLGIKEDNTILNRIAIKLQERKNG